MTPFGWILEIVLFLAVIGSQNDWAKAANLFLLIGVLVWGTGTGI